MTAYDVIDQALALLGYSSGGNTEQVSRIMGRAVMIVNAVYADISDISAENENGDIIKILSLWDEIDLPKRAQSVMVYGTAAFAAQSEGDSEAQQMWMSVYNRKRAGLSAPYIRNDIFGSLTESEDDDI